MANTTNTCESTKPNLKDAYASKDRWKKLKAKLKLA